MPTITIQDPTPKARTLRDVKVGDLFTFEGTMTLDGCVYFALVTGGRTEEGTGRRLTYRFIALNGPSTGHTWSGGSGSPLNEDRVRVFPKGTILTVTV